MSEPEAFQRDLAARALDRETVRFWAGTDHEPVCPDCLVERADYEGAPGKHLPECPNCGSDKGPVVSNPAKSQTKDLTEDEGIHDAFDANAWE